MIDIYEEIDKALKEEKREKDADQFKIYAEIFDERTLMILYDLSKKGLIEELHGTISSGKEANVLVAKDKNGRCLAIKVYRIETTEFRNMWKYLLGDPRFPGIRKSRRKIIYLWVKKEFRNLKRAYEVGVRVPEPIKFKENVLVMEFIGKDWTPAPTLHEAPPENLESAKNMFNMIKEYLKKLYVEAELVHGDLSEYNVLNHEGKPVLIDWAQAVTLDHPQAYEFLERDIKNIFKYFTELGIKEDWKEFYKKLIKI